MEPAIGCIKSQVILTLATRPKSYYFNRNMPLEELVSEAKNWKRLPMNDIILLGES